MRTQRGTLRPNCSSPHFFQEDAFEGLKEFLKVGVF